MKRKEIKWQWEGRAALTGRQDGVIFRIWWPYDAPEKGYNVDSKDTKEKGRDIRTAGPPGAGHGGGVHHGGGAPAAGKGWRQWRTFSRYLIRSTA